MEIIINYILIFKLFTKSHYMFIIFELQLFNLFRIYFFKEFSEYFLYIYVGKYFLRISTAGNLTGKMDKFNSFPMI